MSYAYRARKKAMRRALEEAEPDRRNVRNLIKRGKARRFTILKDPGGVLIKRGTYRYKGADEGTPEQQAKARAAGMRIHRKRAFVLRMSGLIRYTSGIIFNQPKKPKKSGGLLAKLTGG